MFKKRLKRKKISPSILKYQMILRYMVIHLFVIHLLRLEKKNVKMLSNCNFLVYPECIFYFGHVSKQEFCQDFLHIA